MGTLEDLGVDPPVPSVMDALKAAATTTHVGTARALMPIIKDMILRDPLFLKDLRLALFEGVKTTPGKRHPSTKGASGPIAPHGTSGPQTESRTSYEKVVLGLMQQNPNEPYTAGKLLDHLNHLGVHRGKRPLDYIRLALTKLVRQGSVVRPQRGIYVVVADTAAVSDATAVTPTPDPTPRGSRYFDFFKQLETRFDV